MRILFITAFPPSRQTAGQNYTRLLLADLGKSNQVDLICWGETASGMELPESVKLLRRIRVKSKLSALKRFWYFPLFTRRYDKQTARYIQSIADQYDMVYFDFSQVMMFAKDVKHPFKVGMSHDVISQKFQRKGWMRPLGAWVRHSEKAILKNLSQIHTFSEKDSRYLRTRLNIPSSPVSFYISPEIQQIDLSKIPTEDYLVAFGAWGRPENQETLHWILKNCKSIGMPVKIIGGGMPEELKSRFSDCPEIELTGFVDDPYPVIAGSKGLLAPLWQGAGVKVKVIESLALGTPVLGTEVTFEGIDNIPYQHGMACILLNDDSLTEAVGQLKKTTREDKETISKQFRSNYGANKFIELLSQLQ